MKAAAISLFHRPLQTRRSAARHKLEGSLYSGRLMIKTP
jgi:hypothetical protein